ncbi:hypothetical protein SAMN02910358_00494 [Lachnospiraceae bacterium XBB1006]|nr:hypothetical protein SAMN02910358_00494 [Lachnospiraceae bacterium XBB1006]
MRKVKYILVIAFLIIMSGKLDPVDSSASNHYNEGSASEEENIFYNVANSDEEFATDEWTYDPTVIDEARIERKAEAYAKETGKDVNEVKKSLLESAEEL